MVGSVETAPTLTSKPRWGTPRRLDHPTRGGLDRQVAALLGWHFFPWQSDFADVAGEYHPSTKVPVYRTCAASVARQNGKTTLVCARIARQLIPPRQTVAYAAQDRALGRTKWEEHVELLMSTAFAERVARVDHTNQREMLVMQNGSRYMPVTPSGRKAARSLSLDLAIIDEAHAHASMDVVGAIAPTMAARPHAQIWLLSNAGTSSSGLWRHYTDLGRLETSNPASTMCWFEYAADMDADVFDHAAWADANPSLGLPGGILEQALSDAALTMDRDIFMREHLNIWQDARTQTAIDPVAWAACHRPDVVPTEGVAFALDFTPERDRGALAVAGRVDDDGDLITPIELIEAGSDLERLVNRAAEVANAWDGLIVIDRGSPAASAIPALERMTARGDGRHRVRLIPLSDFVRACGEFHDAARSARIAHRGDYRLTDAVTSASKRRVGEAGWAWARRGRADITPLVAATLARWGVLTAPEELVPAVF
jgi:hypothetical protein